MGWQVGGGKVVVVENFAGWQGRGVKRDRGGRIRKKGEYEYSWVGRISNIGKQSQMRG